MYGNVIKEAKYVDGKVVSNVVKHEESIKGTDKQALAEFLKLMDDHTAGRIQDYSIYCESKEGKIKRFKKIYTELDLQ